MNNLDIHRREKIYNRGLSLIENSKQISRKNKDNIYAFVDKLQKQPNLSLSRINIYLFRLSVICKNIEKDLSQCNFNDVQNLIDKMRSGEMKKQNGEPYSKRSAENIAQTFKRYYNLMGNKRLAKKIKVHKIRTKIDAADVWTDKERKLLPSYSQNPMQRAFLGIMAECGTRCEEAGTLRLKDITILDNGHVKIFISRSKTVQRENFLIWSATDLRLWYDMHPHRDSPDCPVFISPQKNENGNHNCMSYNGLVKWLKEAASNFIKNKPVHLHILRHTSITLDLRAGIPISIVSKKHGVSISEIERTYSHLVSDDIYNEQLKVNGLTKKQEQPTLNRCKSCGSVLAIGDECGICKKMKQDQQLHYERIKLENEKLTEKILGILAKHGVMSVSKNELPNI
ncbi:MAG: site-specific integrase [Euryarchaeota archaeon]|nr:site-specific integrase [Euryarchaeota archaeon]MBU4143308.1 site-specific integrase [Candidatus Thermoplasmatota archaeon]